MTTENDYIEMANDCASRINDKNKELDKLKRTNEAMALCLADVKMVSNNMLTIYDILNEITKGTRRGESTVCMNRLNNCLQDIDLAFQTLNEAEFDCDEMDMLTRLTIQQLSN
jgi:hypothetical protein